MWKESYPQCTTRSCASSSNKFFPRFYDLMLGLHLFSCRGVRSEQFVKGKNSPSSRWVCIWSSASSMTLWKSLRRDEAIGHLAQDLKCRRAEGREWWHRAGRSVCEPPFCPAEQTGDSVCMALGGSPKSHCLVLVSAVHPHLGWIQHQGEVT